MIMARTKIAAGDGVATLLAIAMIAASKTTSVDDHFMFEP
jgi:hypothetical protein